MDSRKQGYQTYCTREERDCSLHFNLIPVDGSVFETIIGLLKPVPCQSAHHSKTWKKENIDV